MMPSSHLDVERADPPEAGMALCLLGEAPSTLCEMLAGDPAITAWLSPSEARAALDAAADLRLLLIYDAPDRVLVPRLETAAPECVADVAARAWAEWRTDAEALLALLRGHRPRLTLVETGMALHHPGVLADRLGLAEATRRDLVELSDMVPAPAPLAAHLAGDILRADPGMRRLLAQLDAAALDLSNGRDRVGSDPEAAYADYLVLRDRVRDQGADLAVQSLYHAELSARLSEAEDRVRDHDALREHGATVELMAAKTAGRAARLAADLAAQEAELARLAGAEARAVEGEAQAATLKDALEAREAELSHLAQAREAAEAALAEMRDLLGRAEMREAQGAARLARLEADLEALAETRDRLGRAEAQVADLETVRAEASDLADRRLRECESLQTQLHDSQARAERYVARARDRARKIEEMHAAADRLAEEKAALQARVEAAETWLNGIQQSRSYRLMAPLRRVRGAMLRRRR